MLTLELAFIYWNTFPLMEYCLHKLKLKKKHIKVLRLYCSDAVSFVFTILNYVVACSPNNLIGKGMIRKIFSTYYLGFYQQCTGDYKKGRLLP